MKILLGAGFTIVALSFLSMVITTFLSILQENNEPAVFVNSWHEAEKTGKDTTLYPSSSKTVLGYLVRSWRGSGLVAKLNQVSLADTLPAGQCYTQLAIGNEYMQYFYGLSQRSANQVLRALRDAPLYHIDFWAPPPTLEAHLDRWLQLCEALGSVPTLKKIQLYDMQVNTRAAVMGIQNWRQITELSLYGRSDMIGIDGGFHELAHALKGHPTLVSFKYSLRTSELAVLLHALRSIATLQELVISYGHSASTSQLDAQVVANTIDGWPLESITLQGFRLEMEEASTSFCDGVASSQAKTLRITDCLVVNASQMVEALAVSGALSLKLDSWPEKDGNNLFLSLVALAEKLPTMMIESLDIERLSMDDHTGVHSHAIIEAISQVLPMVIRAAALCPTLVELKIAFAYHSDAMDEALAYLAETSGSRLKKLVVPCASLQQDVDDHIEYPRFLQALKSNHALEDIEFKSIRNPGYPDFLSSKFLLEVAELTRRNRGGVW